MDTNLKVGDPQGALRYFRDKLQYTTGPAELDHAISGGRKVGVDFNLIDVRDARDFAKAHIPEAVNLPEEDWSTLAGLSSDRVNLIYGETPVSHVAARAAVEFAAAGFPVMELEGGFLAWEEHGFAIARPSPKSSRVGLRTGTSEGPNAGRNSIESLL
jgi:rhodanese-related sulfurtransferase